VAVVLDTLNRSLTGSESSDEDMTAYVRAADSVCEAFNCAVVVVHHCGIESSRPRGHTSLTGAADAQIAVKRNAAGTIEANVEFMKDGPEGDSFAGRLESVQVGLDDDGEPITSCVVEPVDPITDFRDSSGPKLTPNQDTMLSILIEAGPGGRDVEKWNEEARDVGIGIKRKATLHDIRNGLKKKGLVHTTMGRWYVTNV
jgi:hypothetical protein